MLIACLSSVRLLYDAECFEGGEVATYGFALRSAPPPCKGSQEQTSIPLPDMEPLTDDTNQKTVL